MSDCLASLIGRDKRKKRSGLAIGCLIQHQPSSALSVCTTCLHLPSFFDLTDQNIDQWIDARDAESDIYLIRERGTGSIIGLMFITPPFNNDIHLGYLLGQSAWGHGYASELLAGLVLHVPKIGFRLLGGVGRENPASAHVLRQTGFQLVPELRDTETESLASR